jgi:hypothetical protein
MSHARAPESGGRFTGSPWVKASVAVLAVAIVVATGYLLVSSLLHSGSGAQVTGSTAHSAVQMPSAPPPSGATGPASPSPSGTASGPGRRAHRNPFTAGAAAAVSARSGQLLAAVYDIRTRQSWTLGQGPAQDEASIVKLDILATLLSRSPGAGTGLTTSDTQLAGQMIEESDNDAATSLWYSAGGPSAIEAFNSSAGLRHTTPSTCVQCPDFPWPGWGLTKTTAKDQITLLRQLIGPHSRLTDSQRDYVLHLMEDVTPSQRWGISGGVPSRAKVALKNGWLPLNSSSTDWQVNSIGRVSGAGRDYLMAVLTTGDPDEQYGIDTISQLAATVWKNMR